MTGFFVAFGTSSPLSSVAILGPEWSLIWSQSEMAPRAATGACAKLLQQGLKETGTNLADALAFGADLGPGSFTGIRVGIMLAKTLAYANQCQAFGANAFDLVSPNETVSVPSRKNEWWVRVPSEEPNRLPELVGLGYPSGNPHFPTAAGFATLTAPPELISPELLVPLYLADPSISTPKRAYGLTEAKP